MTKTVNQHLRLHPQMRAALDEYAQLTGGTVTGAIEQMVFSGLMDAEIYQKHLGDNRQDIISQFERVSLIQAIARCTKAGYELRVADHVK